MATLDEIKEALEAKDYIVERLDDQTLRILDRLVDGIEVVLVRTDTEILVQTTLIPVSAVDNPAKINERILKTHKLIPLTTVGIEEVGGEDYYIAFGSLAAESRVEVVVKEVDFLYVNLEDIAELFIEEELAQEKEV